MYFPLTHSQKRIWYMEQIHPHLPMYNVGGIVRVKGRVDHHLLEEAIHLFLQRHEGLHLQVCERDGDVAQFVRKYRRTSLPLFDFTRVTESQAAAREWAEAEFRRPFHLLEQRLFYFALLKITEQENGYFVKFHHLIADGWSIQIMTDQISHLYLQLCRAESIGLVPEPIYIEYFATEQEYLASPRFEKNRRYWLEQFASLPDGFLRPSSDLLVGQRWRSFLGDRLSERVKRFAERERCSLNTFFSALVLMYLYKTTSQQDLIIGTPVMNRLGARQKRMMGMFTSTVPFRTTVHGEETVAALIRRVNWELRECYVHQKYPYDLLVHELQLRKQGLDQLFQVCVNYYNTKPVDEWDGIAVENEEFYSGYQTHALQVVIKEWQDGAGFELQFDFKAADYTDTAIRRMRDNLVCLAEQILTDDGQSTIDQLTLLTEAEHIELVHGRNSTAVSYPRTEPVYQLFTAQARRTPERTALYLDGLTMTYQELHQQSNRLAHVLSERGIGRGWIVAVLLDHSFAVPTALLAVLKAGAAYLPIDPAYPPDGIEYLLGDSRTTLVLTDSTWPEGVKFDGEVLRLDRLDGSHGSPDDLTVSSGPDDLAYVIYTSGSTGKPKGAMITHGGLVNYVWWAKGAYLRDESDVTALYTSLAFDLTVTSIFPPLISGCAVAIYPAREEFALERILRDGIATVVKLTPAHLALIRVRDNRSSSVHTLVVGGEDLKAALASEIDHSFGGNVTIYNEYGPTEAVVGCMIHRYEPAQGATGSVPIGVPIHNMRIYLLDPHGQPVPVGMIGEIYIAGDGVALGYLHRDDLTSERFLEDPFQGGRMYRTGDLAMWREDGTLEYVGRSDSQVKVRGYRVELGEVENRLLEVDGVQDAVVVDTHDRNGQTALVGYLTTKRPLTALEVRQALLELVPAYMVPAYLVFLPALPITPNGKVDRKGLPDPLVVSDQPVPAGSEAIRALMLAVMQDVLQVERLSAGDNFYHLGGDSIKAIQISARLREAGLSLKVSEIQAYPVIGELAALVEVQRASRLAEQSPAAGWVERTPITAWFFAQEFTNPHHYNQSVLLALRAPFSPDQVRAALTEIVRHHDALRLRYDEQVGKLWHAPALLSEEPAVEEATVQDPAELQELASACKAGMHLVKGPLLRALLIHVPGEPDRLLLTAHHLLVDAVSWHIVLEDMQRLLQGFQAGAPVRLPARGCSYQGWAEALARAEWEDELSYWQAVVADEAVELPYDFEGGTDVAATCQTVTVALTAEETERLMGDANRAYSTRPVELLVTALAMALHERSGREAVTLELEGHGREPLADEMDLSRTVGWFTSLYPVRVPLPRSEDATSWVRGVKEELRRVPRQGIGYGLLTYIDKKLPAGPKRVRFNYLGVIDNQSRNSLLELCPLQSGSDQDGANRLTARLDIMAYVQDRSLRLSLAYSQEQYRPDTIEGLADCWLAHLQCLTDHCCGRDGSEYTPSDFDTVDLTAEELDRLFDRGKEREE